MSLIKCPICKNLIEDTLSVCPNCDCKMEQIIAYLKNDKNKILEDFDVVGGLLKKYKGSNKTIIIPPSVKRINFGVFYNSNIENVVVSNNVVNISTRAFSNCKKLKKVYIGKEVEAIGSFAFSNCDNLSMVGFLGSKEIELGQGIFDGCEQIEKIVCIDENVKNIIENSDCVFDTSKIILYNKKSVENIEKNEDKIKSFIQNDDQHKIEAGSINITILKQDYIDAYNKIQLFLKESNKQGSIKELLSYVGNNIIFKDFRYNYVTRAMSSDDLQRGLYVEIPKLNYRTNNTSANVVINKIISLIQEKAGINKTEKKVSADENNKNIEHIANNSDKIIIKQESFETTKKKIIERLKKYSIEETSILICKVNDNTPFCD